MFESRKFKPMQFFNPLNPFAPTRGHLIGPGRRSVMVEHQRIRQDIARSLRRQSQGRWSNWSKSPDMTWDVLYPRNSDRIKTSAKGKDYVAAGPARDHKAERKARRARWRRMMEA